jgi:hypothetical protein
LQIQDGMKESILLRQILLQLGSSAEQVASTLRANHIKGVRNTVRYLNPIVRFAQTQGCQKTHDLCVTHGDGMATYTLRMTPAQGEEEQTFFPEPVREFLDAFNKGAHPDMELSPEIQ